MSLHMNTDEQKEQAVSEALAVRARFAALSPAALQAAVAGLLTGARSHKMWLAREVGDDIDTLDDWKASEPFEALVGLSALGARRLHIGLLGAHLVAHACQLGGGQVDALLGVAAYGSVVVAERLSSRLIK
jgi:hypothetical protein